MAVCKCGSDMIIDGTKWVCRKCPLTRDIHPAVKDPWEENTRLRHKMRDIKEILRCKEKLSSKLADIQLIVNDCE